MIKIFTKRLQKVFVQKASIFLVFFAQHPRRAALANPTKSYNATGCRSPYGTKKQSRQAALFFKAFITAADSAVRHGWTGGSFSALPERQPWSHPNGA